MAGAGIAVSLTAGGCGVRSGYDANDLVRPDLLGALDAARVRALGSAYRAMVPAERGSRSLRAAILDARPWHARLTRAASPGLAELVRADFEAGRTVVVDGWILSVTEARQCALFSLLPA